MALTSCNIILQSLALEHLRGKVMVLYTMSFIGMMRLGSLVFGSLANLIGSVKPVFSFAGIISVGYRYILMKVMPDLEHLAQRGFNTDEP